MNELEGANCAGLHGFVIDKYFNCDAGKEPLRAMVALAICGNCLVLEACREQALNSQSLPDRGILAGVSIAEIRRARSWQRFEQGGRDTVPPVDRPSWLPMSEAAQEIEQLRTETDPDEHSDDL